MLKSTHFTKFKKGVTLIELLVVIFIFSIILIVISTALVQGFMTGRLHSSATKDINRELNAATALISQKMTNANTEVTLSTSPATTIYGFAVLSGNILAIVNNSSGTPQCTFFGTYNQALYMRQDNCANFTSIQTFSNLDQRITTGITKITDFSFPTESTYICSTTPCTTAPYVTVSITGQDTSRTNATVTLQETYSLNYAYDWLK